MQKKEFSVTKTQGFNAIAKALKESGIATLEVEVDDKTLTFDPEEFLAYQVELIANKKSSPKAKVDNTENIEIVRKALTENPGVTATDLVAITGLPNTQKVSAVIKAMGNAVKIEKNGKKTTYTLA